MIDYRRCRGLLLVVLWLLSCPVAILWAQEKSLKPGINDSYQKQEVARVVERFERQERDVVKKSNEILAACQLKPGTVIADVGAGTGFFTRLMAPKVAPGGKVYAVDVTTKFVAHIKKTCQDQGIDNVATAVSTAQSTGLPAESVDLVFTCDTYHHFEYPFKMLASMRRALRPAGRLVIVDRKQANDHVRADQKTVRREVTEAGYRLVSELDLSEREYLMCFQKAEDATANTSTAATSTPGASAGPGKQCPARLDRALQVTLDYWLYLPEDYEKQDRWPLVLFLHGAGERGSDLALVKKHGPPKLVQAGKQFPFILVSPQCPLRRWWQPMELTALLDEIVAKYKVDRDRIYVTGLSMGGFGTWGLAAYTPDRFAAVAPVCGGGEPYWTREFAHLPVWAFHGGKDSVVPVERSQEMVDALKEHGGAPKFTVYPEAGHDSWTETYDNPELYKWLLGHKRSANKPAKTEP